MSAQPVPIYLTAQQVAERYGMKIDWVYGCRSLPRRKLGKSLRFLESELEVWEKRHTGNTRVYTFHHFDPQPVVRKHRDYRAAVPPTEAAQAILESLQAFQAQLTALTKAVTQYSRTLRYGLPSEVIEPVVVPAPIAVISDQPEADVAELAAVDKSQIPVRPDDLTVADVCRLQNVKPEVVQRWIRCGYLPAERRSTIRGKRLFVSKKDYEQFIHTKRRIRAVSSSRKVGVA